MSLKIDFEQFKKSDEKELISRVNDAVREAVDQVADIIVEAAKQIVPVDTGTLQSSIRKETAEHLISVIAGGADFINPKTGKPCDYAAAVEVRQPFMKLALTSAEHEIEAQIRQKVHEKFAELEWTGKLVTHTSK